MSTRGALALPGLRKPSLWAVSGMRRQQLADVQARVELNFRLGRLRAGSQRQPEKDGACDFLGPLIDRDDEVTPGLECGGRYVPVGGRLGEERCPVGGTNLYAVGRLLPCDPLDGGNGERSLGAERLRARNLCERLLDGAAVRGVVLIDRKIQRRLGRDADVLADPVFQGE